MLIIDRRDKHSGFSLIEVMVTLTITVVGLVGLATLQLQANRATLDTGNRSQAVWITQDLINRIRANPEGNYDTNNEAVDCAAPARICVAFHNGNSRQAAQSCSAQQLAISDLWEVACGTPATASTGTIRSSSANFIANPQLIINDSNADQRIEITLSWDSRTSGKNSADKTIYAIDAQENTSRSELTTVVYR